MDALSLVPSITAAALYLFAGKQTFMLMMLTDPRGDDCPLVEGYRRRDAAFFVTVALFLLAWPAIFAVATFAPKPKRRGR